MSLRDDSFRAMLGRDPSSTEWQDIEQLQRATGMNRDEAFWGVIAFLYARTKPDIEGRAQLQLVLKSLNRFEERLDQGLQIDRLVASVTAALRPGLAELSQGRVDPGHPTTPMESALQNAKGQPGLSPTKWLGNHFATALDTGIGLFVGTVLAIGLAWWTGAAVARRTTRITDHARLMKRVADAGPIRAWALTRNGQRVYAWAQLNRPSLQRILSCRYPGWTRQPEDGYVICYPNGGQHGFYVPTR